MGSVAKAVKKVTKRISRPISKITKGIAKGIVKVGKATMRGVAKIQNKLGPLGSIAMAIAMPYALSGLSGMIGTAGGTTGFMNSTNVFLKSIGTVGNAVRTGYQGVTGFVNAGMKGITKSIGQSFSKMGKGNNIFSRISNGAKTLFQKSRAAVQKFKPFTSKGGSVDVTGFKNATGPASWNNTLINQSMSSTQAGQLLADGVIGADQLTGQTFSKTGWLTKANPMDKAVSEAINDTYKTNIMSNFDSSATKAFNEYMGAADAGGQKYNYENINNMMGDSLTSDGTTTSFNFEKSGDYALRQAGGGGQGTYEFNGNKTFKTNNGTSTLSKVKKAATSNKVLDSLSKSLLKQDPIPTITDLSGLYGDTTQETSGATSFGGTNIEGSSGGSLLEGAFNKAQQEQIMNYYKNMNIIGSS